MTKTNTFEMAKKIQEEKKSKPWYLIKGKKYTYYIWALPLVPIAYAHDTYKDWRYNSLEWSEEKATKMLSKILPKMLEWVEEDNAYYFCMDWGTSNYQYQVKLWERAWVRKFSYKLRDFVRDGYENPNYTKTVEKDYYDTWVKFVEKEG